jgi:LysM repeat protein
VTGDTLASVARRTNTAIDALAAGNCLSNANIIYVGQVLRVPVAIQAEQPQQPSGSRIQFPAGATSVTVRGQLAVGGMDHWTLRALAGQTLSAQLGFSSGQAILIVWGADGSVLMSDHAGATSFSRVLPLTEDYYIDVRGNPSTPTNYTLTVTIPPLPAPAPASAHRIQFAAGAISATVQSQLVASGSDRWVLKAGAGQTLSVQLGFFSGQAVLVIWGADGTVLLSDHAGASSFVGVLPLTEDYYIDVRGFSSSPTSYTLTVTIPPH